jgi:hypothetical protein
MQVQPFTRNALASIYFGGGVMLTTLVHDMGAPLLAIAAVGLVFALVPMVRQ